MGIYIVNTCNMGHEIKEKVSFGKLNEASFFELNETF